MVALGTAHLSPADRLLAMDQDVMDCPDEVFGGVTIPAGDQIICLPGVANRDPAHFDDPDRFDIRHSPNRHIAFGAGIHHCIGLSLARLELRLALLAITRRIPGLQLDTDHLTWRRTFQTRGLTALPVRW